MESIGLLPVLTVATLLLVIGGVGVLARRNILIAFMGLELMLNGANLALVGFARQLGDGGGQVMALFVMAVAAAEVAVGLALVILLFRSRATANMDHLDELKG